MTQEERSVREVAVHRRARRNYEILDKMEVGIALEGTEVKSLRAGRVSLEEAYIRYKDGQFWLVGAHIDEYSQGNVNNHEPARERRLLARRREAERWGQRVKEKGLTIVPLRLYFSGKWAKLEIGLGRGRRQFDKREAVKKRETDRALRGIRRRG